MLPRHMGKSKRASRQFLCPDQGDREQELRPGDHPSNLQGVLTHLPHWKEKGSLEKCSAGWGRGVGKRASPPPSHPLGPWLLLRTPELPETATAQDPDQRQSKAALSLLFSPRILACSPVESHPNTELPKTSASDTPRTYVKQPFQVVTLCVQLPSLY